ncbi:MAG: hypothetical protein ACRC68_12555, partial [Clostridium sp.]
FDVYITLAHISSEIKGKFIIQTYSDNRADIINLVNKYLQVSYRTIHNNINELISLGILEYSNELSSWLLVDMDTMVKSKANCDEEIDAAKLKGYTKIREFFITSEFYTMKSAEKRCMVYLAQLCDSKASNSYSEFVMNLSKSNSSWLKVFKTKSKYYARKVVKKMLNQYKDIFDNTSDELRAKDIAPKTISGFKFSFSCKEIQKEQSENTQYDFVKLINVKEFELVKEKIKFANITLNKNQVMHMVRAISTIKQWFLKDRVAQIIINKYIAIQIHHSRENIKSLPAYLVAVTKAVISEYKEFKDHISSRDLTYEETEIVKEKYSTGNLKPIFDLI